MREIVDLRGGSGRTYRFRLWPEGAAHTPMAGNYVVLREEPAGFTVVLAGTSEDLSGARTKWRKAARDQSSTHVFTRLNVSRAVRVAEHDDLVAHYRPKVSSEAEA
ncbi:hypothetical protein [Phenylobacterium hankyongense]|nr:hypothetical protein [Phenylobacterium hankyongense]